eukprot:Skav209779  [mRNA]  locus=scaffold9:583773:585128:- [translate_table: standard]
MALSEGVDWCVATPGRLLDFLTRRQLSLQKLAVLVLDEADRMLDQGFEPDLRKITEYRPARLQSLLFTATWEPSTKVQALANEFLVGPQVIQISAGTRSANPRIRHQFYVCRSDREKMKRLIEQIDGLAEKQKLIVFVNTKMGCVELQSSLARLRRECFLLQGDMDQASREASLMAFKNCNPGVLVATDVAARGLDIENVAMVVNYDMCQPPVIHLCIVWDVLVADYLGAAEESMPELLAFLADDNGSTLSGATAGGYTHNTGLTRPNVELQGHQLARVLASDELVVKETLRRGARGLPAAPGRAP